MVKSSGSPRNSSVVSREQLTFLVDQNARFRAAVGCLKTVALPAVQGANSGISPGEARDLIERFGNDRETLEQEAKKLKGS